MRVQELAIRKDLPLSSNNEFRHGTKILSKSLGYCHKDRTQAVAEKMGLEFFPRHWQLQTSHIHRDSDGKASEVTWWEASRTVSYPLSIDQTSQLPSTWHCVLICRKHRGTEILFLVWKKKNYFYLLFIWEKNVSHSFWGNPKWHRVPFDPEGTVLSGTEKLPDLTLQLP